jgi:hypothetical protein
MITLNLKPTRSAKTEFNFVDFDVLSCCATILINNINYDNIDRKYEIKVDVSRFPIKNPCSLYLWKKNKICINSHKRYKKAYVLRRFINCFIHELKHWSQDKLLKVSFFKNYSDGGKQYYSCPLEKDTRQYTALLLNATLKNYNALLDIKQRSLEYKKLNIQFNY